MTKNNLYKLKHVVLLMGLALSLAGCNETFESFFSEEIAEGEAVMFTTALPSAPATRGSKADYEQEMDAYQPVNDAYELTVEMYTADDVLVGSSTYSPVAGTDMLGTLAVKDGITPLYWTSTTVPYAFKATAGMETLSSIQNTQKDWLLQDRLEGYGYIQKWDDVKNAPVDQLTALNYHTAKDWRALNKETWLFEDEDDYKKIPLYLQHQRSLVTVILKAGEGVGRRALAFDVAQNDLSAEIYSYTTEAQTITPLAREEFIHYDADKNGGAEDSVSTTRYDAIVEPYNYADNPTTDAIVRVSLSGQHYSFYADNDFDFQNNRDAYHLTPGKHLTLTVTLSRDSRKVLMTAQIEDWTEQVTNTICDDYGNAGEPITIKTRDELIRFLQDKNMNKAGNIALITANIELETPSASYPGDWSVYNQDSLHCTLSLGGTTLIGNHRFVKVLDHPASLQNGTIQIGGQVDAAIAITNQGTIDDVRVTAKESSYAYATVAGAVETNNGTISRCHSSLKVKGNAETDYVGGIAATSLSTDTQTAAIDACTVNNSVKGGKFCGGIVGNANGIVSNNSFEYGITLLQNKETQKNIVGAIEQGHSFTAENNAWPTVDEDYTLTNATAEAHRYSGIIDDEDELKVSVGTSYNAEAKRYRLAQDISVTEKVGSISYELDGNNKTVSTSAMIFNTITGQVHDMTVFVSENLIAEADKKAATDAIAPLAFDVHGTNAEIRNVKVKMADGTKIQASNPAGMVVWVWGGASVSGCEVQVNLFADVEASITQGRKFAGGIVSTVSNGHVTQCILHSGSSFDGTESSIIFYGGIVGGIEQREGSNETPELTITDCTSFLKMTKDVHHGCILGNALHSTTLATKDCQGNWWDADCNGVGTYTGYSVEAAIGKRNAVVPSEMDF